MDYDKSNDEENGLKQAHKETEILPFRGGLEGSPFETL